MELFYNLKIAKKLSVFIGLMVIFLAAIGITGYLFNEKSANSMQSMYDDRFLPVVWMEQINSQSWHIKANILDAAIDEDEKIQRIAEVRAGLKKIAEDIALYEKTSLTDTEKEQLKKLKPYYQTFYDYAETNLKLLEENRPNEEIYAYFVENEDSIINFVQTAKVISEENRNIVAETNQQIQKDADLSGYVMLFLLVGAAIFAVISGQVTIKSITFPINRVVENLNELAKGNLNVQPIQNDYQDETGILARALNKTFSNLKELVKDVVSSVERISSASQEMSQSADETAQSAEQVTNSINQMAFGTQQVASNIEEGYQNINDINKAIQKISSDAENTAKLSQNADTNARNGQEYVAKAVTKMESIRVVSSEISDNIAELGQLSTEVENIVYLIKDIAGQTNLLALNAAIESARAGEHGKGFAVVADEVKKLAGQSVDATIKITEMIKDIQSKTKQAVEAMDKGIIEVEDGVKIINDTGEALNQIISTIVETNSNILGITSEINNVAGNSTEVVSMIENISSVTEETAASAEEISSITEEQSANIQQINANTNELVSVCDTLRSKISVFRL